MTNKVISILFLAATIVFFALGNANPDNLLFLFVSPLPEVGIARIILAAGMVLLSFRNVLTTDIQRQGARGFGLSLMAFGALCMIITPLGNDLYNVFKLLDWMIIAEAGIIFTSATLAAPEEEPQATKMKSVKPSLKQKAA